MAVGLRNRDLEVYKSLFFQYHGRLVLFAYKFTGEMEAARDIVQDTFMALWEKSDTLTIQLSPKAYLFQAVRNRSLNYFRNSSTRHGALARLAERIDREERKVYADFNNPFHSFLELEMQEKIGDIIGTMPEKCREIFLLSREKDLKNREIAEKMGISTKMVEKYISRALRTLRLELSEYMSILYIAGYLFF
ncbi:MAG: RNA polymerase sigma-70 factor [Prolixibacteraceae bacterium]